VNAKWINRLERTVALALSLTVLFLLIVRATRAGALWRDECGSVQLALMPTFGEVLKNFPHESFPPLFWATLRGYMAAFGTSDAALRAFGFLVGLGLIVVAWLVSRPLHGRSPLLVLTLVGLNTTFLTWGMSVRGYGLGCLALLLTLGFAVRSLRSPSVLNFLGLLGAAIASVQLFVHAIALLGAMTLAAALVLIVQAKFRQALIVIAMASLCAFTFVPYIHDYVTAADWNIVIKRPVSLVSFFPKFIIGLGEPVIVMGALWCGAVLLCAFAAISILRTTPRDKSAWKIDITLFLSVFFVASIVFYYIFLRVLSYATQPWYYLPLVVSLAGTLELIALLSDNRLVQIARVVIGTTALLLLPLNVHRQLLVRPTNIDAVARYLQENASPTDLIVVNPWYLGVSFNRYYHGETPWLTVPMINDHRLHRYDLIKTKMSQPDPLGDLRNAITKALQAGKRLWIVGGARPPEKDLPLSLPPAPDPEFGWNGQAYLNVWSMQLAAFLRAHVREGDEVLGREPGVNINENVPLLVASGWQD
jgi:hypothetical protein